MSGGNGDPRSMLDQIEKPKGKGNEIEEEEQKNNDDNKLVAEGDEDEDEGLDDWGVPANYNSLNLNNALGQQSVWQCVKRPWKPTDAQLTPAQKYTKKKEEERQKLAAQEAGLKKQQGGAGSVAGDPGDIPDDEDDDEPGDGDTADDKFHYYWRLSAPELYKRAGAVGMHWRAIRYTKKEKTKPNGMQEEQPSIMVGWINEARWRLFCQKTSGDYKSIVIHIIEGTSVVETPDIISSIEFPDKNSSSLNAAGKRVALIQHVNVALAADKDLQKEAQKLMTKDAIIEEEKAAVQNGQAHSPNPTGTSIFTTTTNNDNIPQADPDLPFRFTDGTFPYSKGAFEEVPTVEPIDGEKTTDRLYVKLRRKHIKLLEISGGVFNAAQGDTFILKTTLDKLAGMVEERDPTIQALDATVRSAQWKSDPRDQLTEEEIREMEAERKRKEDSKGRRTMEPKPSTKTTRDERSKARKEVSIWVRNANGFAFQFVHKNMEQKAWNEYRRESIGSLDEDRGWTRYIDPPIPLYIVPCSSDDDAAVSMHISIVQAMNYLDMPSEFLEVDSEVKKADKKMLAKLRRAQDAKPDCATKILHLIQRSGIASKELVKLAISPFGHYETWITETDWTSYNDTRKGRTTPTPKDNENQIKEARRLLREKGAEAQANKVGSVTVEDEATKKALAKNEKKKKETDTKNEKKSALERKLGRKADKSNEKIADMKETAEEIALKEQKLTVSSSNIEAPISSTKIRRAKGTRSGVEGQAAVMGCSATLIAHAFEWNDYKTKTPGTTIDPKWPGTTHMPAEWLHRCAYSWGGLTDEPKSSQDGKNLIFGTGECNSIMTRYEKAWQALVCREGDRLKPAGDDGKKRSIGDAGSGTLYANINRAIYSNQFGFEEVPGSNENKFSIEQPLKSEDQLKELPHWLCYALDYQLVQRNGVEPLGNRKNFKTVFYPWQRGFFTKFEQKLDEVVLEQAYEKWEKNNPNFKPTNVPADIKGQNKGGKETGKEETNKRPNPSGSINDFENKGNQSDGNFEKEDPDKALKNKDKGNKVIKTEGVKNDSMNGHVSNTFSSRVKRDEHDFMNSAVSNTISSDAERHDQIFSSNQFFSGNQFHNLVVMPVVTPDTEKFWSVPAPRDADADAEVMEEAGEERAQEKDEADTTENMAETTENIAQEANAVIPNAEELTFEGPTPEMNAIWEEVHAPGPTLIDGLLLSNAKIVVGRSDPSDSIEANDFKMNDSDNNMSSDSTDWAAAGVAESIDKVENEASSHDSNVPKAKEEPSLPPQADAMPEPVFDRTETSEIHTIQTLPKTKLKEQLFAEQAFSELEPTAQQKLKPTKHIHRQEQQQRPQGAQEPGSTATKAVPNMFVVQADFLLFGRHKVELNSLQSAAQTGAQHYRIALPTELSLGVFIPSLAGSDLDAIALRDTTVTYRSRGRRAGLMLTTTITLSGMLQPVNTLLRDVFGQTTPHIDVTTLLSSSLSPRECLTRIPEPLGFTMRGELPEVNVPDLFGVLTVTHIGVDVMGRRLGSAGGYELEYAFFGRGHVGMTTRVEWRINKFGEHWSISIYTESSSWKNVAGIDGVNLKDVFMQAAWVGTKLSTVRLDLRATFSIKEQATLMLQGKLGKNDFEVAGYLTNCSLTTLKQLYNQTFKTDIDVTTEHEIVLDSLVLIVSKDTGISLYGSVSVDGHLAAEAGIFIGGGSIDFEGHLTGDLSVGNVKIEQPALAVSIYTSNSSDGSGFEVQFSGTVSVTDKHRFDVLVYVNKTSNRDLEYTLYGSYDGNFYLHDLMDSLKNTDLLRGVGMRKLAICASNMENPAAKIKTKPPGYEIGRGLTVYAEIDLPAISSVLNVDKGTPFVVCASYRPANEVGDGSKFQISIQIPKDYIFKIEGFSVGNLSLAVVVINSQPSIKISGVLSFPIEDDKKLKLALGLSAGVYEATGEAELKTSWVNPFQLSKAVTINNFKAGFGILYAGGVPSSVTLGGAVVIGEVQGSVLIHTGVDPSKQLLHVKIVNLDVAQLLKTIGNLIDVDITIPGGNNAFFIRKLELYLSTGMELFDVPYPRGIRLEVDMMLFGKHAKLDAEVSTGHVKLKGSIEKFKIGDLVVSAASGDNKDPYIDIELSQKVQRLKVDGKIVFRENNWVIVIVEIDTAKGSFNLYFELVMGDALKILVIATLDGGLPEATQDRVQEIEHEKSSSSSQNQPPTQQQSPSQSLVTQAGQNLVAQQAGTLTGGGQLQGKTFKIHVEVEPDIVNYLVKLANDHLGGERDEAELGRLEASLATAVTALSAAKVKYDAAKVESDAAIDKATKGLDKRMAEIKQDITAEQTRKLEGVAKLDQDERNMVLQAAQDERNLAESEQREAVAADEVARGAHVDVEEWRTRVYALQTADKAVQAAGEVLEAAEAKLAAAQVTVARHTQKEPVDGTANPEYEAWRWEGEDLTAQVESREAKAKTAVADGKLVKLAFKNLNMGSIDEANAKLKELTEKMQDADAAAQARRAAVEVNIAAGVTKAAERRTDLQKRRAAFIAHADTKIDELTRKEAVFEQERSDKLDAARAKNDVGKTDAGTIYDDCLEKHRAADVKLRAYKQLKDSISAAGEVILTPLRFAVNVVGKALNSLLSIQSFVLDGSFSGSSSRVGARVKCKIGGYEYKFSFSVDLGDIVSFFSELWDQIKGVIASVANALLDLARKGIEAVKTFCIEAANEVKKAATTTADAFMRELAAHEQEVKGFLDDIDRGILQPFKLAADQALREISQTLDQAGRDLTRGLIEVGSKIDEIGRDPRGPLGGDPLGLIGSLGRDILGAFGGQVLKFGSNAEMDEGMRRRMMELEALKRKEMEERERRENKSGISMEDIERGEREVAQLREAVQKGEMRLEEISRTGAIGEEELRKMDAEIGRMMRQIEIRQMQGNIQRNQMRLDEMRRTGARREDIGEVEAKIVQMEGEIRMIMADIEMRNIMGELKRGKLKIEEMKRMGLGQDEIEIAEMDLRDLVGRKELRERRGQLEKDGIELRMMQVIGLGKEELDKRFMKLGERERKLEREMQSREINLQQARAEMDLRMMERKGADQRQLESAKLKLKQIAIERERGDMKMRMQDMQMEIRQMEMQGVNPRDIELANLELRGKEMEMRRKDIRAQMERGEIEIQRMELQGSDPRDIELSKAKLRNMVMEMERGAMREQLERGEMEIRRMEMQGRNPREIQSTRLKLREMRMDIERKKMRTQISSQEMELKQMEMQGANPRDIGLVKLELRGMELEIKRKEMREPIERGEIEIQRMELQGVDPRDIESARAKLRNMEMEVWRGGMREQLERGEIEIQRMELQGSDPRDVESAKAKLREMAMDMARRERELQGR